MVLSESEKRLQRAAVLAGFGAGDAEIEDLLDLNASIADRGSIQPPRVLPLDEELHVEVWREYAEDARHEGAFESLRGRLMQFRFPIAEGVSGTAEYRAATRQGRPPLAAPGLELEAPENLELEIHRTAAGSIPVLVTATRKDFVTLVQALTARNEPAPVPESMGACMVKGLVNWDRVERYRRAWESSSPDGGERGSWQEEFRVLAGRKDLYQDRLVILGSGPYSAVEAGAIGLDHDEWIRRSIVLRRAHESFHYTTLRLFGTMRNAPIDEVIADMVGLVEAFGSYRPDLALRFFGLEDFPTYRKGGRLENYLVDPELSDGAKRVEQAVVKAAVENLGTVRTLDRGRGEEVAITLSALSLEELAVSDLGVRLADGGTGV